MKIKTKFLIPAFLLILTGSISSVFLGDLAREDQDSRLIANKNQLPEGEQLGDQSTSFYPGAESLEDLVNQSDIVVTGKIGSVLEASEFWEYDDAGNLIKAVPEEYKGDRPLLAKYVDYEVKVQQVLKDDGLVKSGRILILRMPDLGVEGDNPTLEVIISEPQPDRSKKQKSRPAPDNRRRLFILKQNPDKKTYGAHYFSQGLLIIDGNTVTLSNGQREALELPGASGNPEKFIQEVKALLKKQGKLEPGV
jgi:hypothetical protein